VVSNTRWLDADEQHTWRSFLTANRLFFDGIERQLQQDHGLPHAYYEIMVRLSESPGRTMRMSQLASTSLSSRSRISHAVARLEEAGWVRRRPCPDDKRGALAELTEAGLANLQQAAPGHVEAVRSGLFDALSPHQVAALREICDTLVAHLSDGPTWPAVADRADDDAEGAAADPARDPAGGGSKGRAGGGARPSRGGRGGRRGGRAVGGPPAS
jgi:DNA-binding MarR family transcriptional regulator